MSGCFDRRWETTEEKKKTTKMCLNKYVINVVGSRQQSSAIDFICIRKGREYLKCFFKTFDSNKSWQQTYWTYGLSETGFSHELIAHIVVERCILSIYIYECIHNCFCRLVEEVQIDPMPKTI